MLHPLRGHGQGAQAFAGGRKDSVADGRRDAYDGGFPSSRRRHVLSIDQDDFHCRSVAEAWNASERYDPWRRGEWTG